MWQLTTQNLLLNINLEKDCCDFSQQKKIAIWYSLICFRKEKSILVFPISINKLIHQERNESSLVLDAKIGWQWGETNCLNDFASNPFEYFCPILRPEFCLFASLYKSRHSPCFLPAPFIPLLSLLSLGLLSFRV